MKFLFRLTIVLISVILFLATSHVIQNWEDFFPVASEDLESQTELASNPGPHSPEVQDHPETTEAPAHQDMDESYHDTNSTEDHNGSETRQDELEPKPEESPSILSYDMDPLDPHSVNHADKMIDIIDGYLSQKQGTYKDLYRQLYQENFFHFEDELARKNKAVLEAIRGHLKVIETYQDDATEDLIEHLEVLKEILTHLTQVE